MVEPGIEASKFEVIGILVVENQDSGSLESFVR